MIIEGRLLSDPDQLPVRGWVAVARGRVVDIGEGPPPAPAAAGDRDSIVCPAFTDAHVHLPQMDAIGCDGRDLLDWLEEVIYPTETRWENTEVVAEEVARAYRRLLAAGTMGYAGYLTSHPHGLDAVRAVHETMPLRAVVGQSLVDRHAPTSLTRQAAAPLPPSSPGDRLRFSVNPRFAVGCTPLLLAEAGRRAEAGEAFVQTHLAEQRAECRRVRELFPDAPHYAAVYDQASLLTPRTLLAHGVHLDEDEWRLLADRGCVVVHCPTANTFLTSGVFDLDAARRHGVRVALGSDVAAGPDLAMPRVARAMIEVAKFRRMTGARGVRVPTPSEAWRLITEGNADALESPAAGRLAVGAPADLLILDPGLPVDADLVGRLIYTWSDEYIVGRVLNGELVAEGTAARRGRG